MLCLPRVRDRHWGSSGRRGPTSIGTFIPVTRRTVSMTSYTENLRPAPRFNASARLPSSVARNARNVGISEIGDVNEIADASAVGGVIIVAIYGN